MTGPECLAPPEGEILVLGDPLTVAPEEFLRESQDSGLVALFLED